MQPYEEYPFRSLHEFLLNAANQVHTPASDYMYVKEDGQWKNITYRETLEKIDALASWFISQGLRKGDKVSIILENCPEYIIIDQALIKIGCVNASIYPTLTPEETAYIINDSESRMLVVGNPFLLRKFRKVESQCPGVFRVITAFENAENDEKVISFSKVIEQGLKLEPGMRKELKARFDEVGKDDLAALIYTSGTTGVPKGVMLTHFNFMSNCYDAKKLCPAINSDDKFLSFLPLSHVFERMATYYLGSYIGARVAFAENIEKVAQNIGEVQPTVMASVPRLLERIHERVYQNATAKGGLSAKIFLWAIATGEQRRNCREQGKTPGPLLSLKSAIAEKLVFSKIKAKMGGRIRMLVSGGGALPQHVGEFFGNIGIQVQEGYGLTETSPFVTVNEFHRQVYGTVGRVAPSQQVAIQDIDTGKIIAVQGYDSFDPAFESGEGEILVKGPNIMKGYYRKPQETAEVFDEDGWFHTGDIGKFDRGYLKITDRLKNMLKTSLGKNIYPTPIENTYLQSPLIEQIVLLGDKREYVTAVIVPSAEELKNKFNVSDDILQNESHFIEDDTVRDLISKDVKKLGETLAKYERIKDFVIKSKPFSIESGEMTVTQKIKRKVVMERYGEAIEKMYTS